MCFGVVDCGLKVNVAWLLLVLYYDISIGGIGRLCCFLIIHLVVVVHFSAFWYTIHSHIYIYTRINLYTYILLGVGMCMSARTKLLGFAHAWQGDV